MSAPEDGRQGADEKQVDVEELFSKNKNFFFQNRYRFNSIESNLKVGQIGPELVQDHDGNKLRQTVGGHVFEDAERGHESAASLPDQFGDAGDARLPGRERGRDGCLRV